MLASQEALRVESQINKRSLGIIKPDEDSIKFIINKLSDEQMVEREAIRSVYQQSLLFNDNTTSPLPSPQYSFKYRYTSAGKPSEMTLHDGEVQAACWNLRPTMVIRRLGQTALQIADRATGKEPAYHSGHHEGTSTSIYCYWLAPPEKPGGHPEPTRFVVRAANKIA